MWSRREIVRRARGRAGWPLRAGYAAVTRLEVAAFSLAGRRHPTPSRTIPDLTVIVKAFERPASLRRMLASLRRVFDGPIVVADDSRAPLVTDDAGVTVIALPFDSGVATGRNAALDAVTTEFVMSVDDDFVFTPDTDLNRVVGHLRRNPEVDIVGGTVINLPQLEVTDYASARLFAYRGEPVRPAGTLIDGLPVLYKVPQFFVARTERLRLVRWDDNLRRVDHNDFFTRAHGVLLTVHDEAFQCLHAQPKFDAHYQAFRRDTGADMAYLSRKWSRRP